MIQGRRRWVRLHEKGGKEHDVPCHHRLDQCLHDYIEQLRIEAARQLLEDSWENLEEIASACGFSSAELMRRAFLRSIGITPSEYRERFRLAGRTPVRSPVQFSSLTAEAGRAA